MKGRVLICAGSDSGGGAGIQADIKSVTALGGYAMTAITALTAQNTLGVQGVLPIEPGFVRAQMRSVLDDLGADAVKTGMLFDDKVIAAVSDELSHYSALPLVVDPVMVAKGGSVLLADSAIGALRALLMPKATLLTPNLPEAEALLGRRIGDLDAMRSAAEEFRAQGSAAVLMKGGHLEGDVLYDVLATAAGIQVFTSTRIATRHTHGTGCTLASAIATGLAQGMTLADAVGRACDYVHRAIATAPGFGGGHGPLNHLPDSHLPDSHLPD